MYQKMNLIALTVRLQISTRLGCPTRAALANAFTLRSPHIRCKLEMAAASCAHEVAVAATWFAEQLFEPNDQRSIFCDRLQELLIARYQGHWYPDEPHRGCAFRSLLSTVNAMDPLLLRAADATGHRGVQESFMRCFSDAGEVTCWVSCAPPNA